MRDVIVIYQMPNRTLAVSLPDRAVDDAKRNGRAAGGPVVAVIRPKLNRTVPAPKHSAPQVQYDDLVPKVPPA